MNCLFIELYLDEDVHVLIAELIRSYGFIATTARDEGMLGSSDEEQLAFAVRQRKAVLTHNTIHFERLAQTYFNVGKSHAGVIIAMRRSPYDLARRAARILNSVTAGEMVNQIRYI